jgi:hypothetical protein
MTEEPPVAPTVRPAIGNARAERAARAAVSRLLLDRYAEVRAGRASGDVFTPLKDDIERLERQFDHPRHYLDAELLRTLAQGRGELMRR